MSIIQALHARAIAIYDVRQNGLGSSGKFVSAVSLSTNDGCTHRLEHVDQRVGHATLKAENGRHPCQHVLTRSQTATVYDHSVRRDHQQ